MSLSKRRNLSTILSVSEIIYLSFVALSFYLLVASRTGEAQTVWQALDPAFIPTLFITTFILIAVLFTSEKTSRKLFFTIVHSILLHSFFSVIFPAGDLSGQQLVLGEVRLVYDNTTLHGLSGYPTKTIGILILGIFKGTNLQAALSTIFARMLGIDIFYVHLFFIPVLWGIFVPIGSFLIAKAISGNEKAAVLSSLVVSALPYTVYFGAISVPDSLGFIFFLFSLYFTLRYISSNDTRAVYLMLVFSAFSFLAHYLTGIMSFSLVFLALAYRTFESEKKTAPTSAKTLLIISFLVSVSLLPLSFIYLRVLGTSSNPAFTLDNLYGLSLQKAVELFLIGDFVYSFDLKMVLLNFIGPVIALTSMIYLLVRLKRDPNPKFKTQIYFLFTAFLIILIDYGITKAFMEDLPINVERLWVLRDFIAGPFIALAVYAVVSSPQHFLKTKYSTLATSVNPKTLSRGSHLQVLTVLITLNVLVPLILGGWITFALGAAYPQIAPLQTTSYELDAVRHIVESAREKYVVIGDIWTIYAGEMIVGIHNPRAYYWADTDKTGHDLFVNMTSDPSPKWMLLAMNYTDTAEAYFIVTEPRLGAEEFNSTVSKAQDVLPVFYVTGEGKLYIFSYPKQ